MSDSDSDYDDEDDYSSCDSYDDDCDDDFDNMYDDARYAPYGYNTRVKSGIAHVVMDSGFKEGACEQVARRLRWIAKQWIYKEKTQKEPEPQEAGATTAAQTKPKKPCYTMEEIHTVIIHIHSHGGIVDELVRILNVLTVLRRRGVHIVTHIHGVAMSCGIMLALMGDKVLMDPCAIAMAHDVACEYRDSPNRQVTTDNLHSYLVYDRIVYPEVNRQLRKRLRVPLDSKKPQHDFHYLLHNHPPDEAGDADVKKDKYHQPNEWWIAAENKQWLAALGIEVLDTYEEANWVQDLGWPATYQEMVKLQTAAHGGPKKAEADRRKMLLLRPNQSSANKKKKATREEAKSPESAASTAATTKQKKKKKKGKNNDDGAGGGAQPETSKHSKLSTKAANVVRDVFATF